MNSTSHPSAADTAHNPPAAGQAAHTFLNDIPAETAQRAFYGVSHFPEKRGDARRAEYAAVLAECYAKLHAAAAKGGTLDLLPAEFERFRDGYRRRYLAFLHSNARCVSWFIAGPSNFPAARMAKRSDIAHKRLNEVIDFRARAMSAMMRTLRPDLRPIYASDGDAIERLELEIASAEAQQERMKAANAAIRSNFKAGEAKVIAALLELGFGELEARKMIMPGRFGGMGFAQYKLTNNSANIRRMKARVAHITELKATPSTVMEGANARFEDVPQENRVRLFFPGKPDEATRSTLKSSGFRWTPTLGCWQAYRNYQATVIARRVAGLEDAA